MKTTLFLILLSLNLVSFGQPKSQYEGFASSSKTLLLSYDDFGPQALASALLGFEWWQWDNHGDSDHNTKYDVRVIVFKGISLKKVKNKYPIDESRKVDFRYVSYAKCIKYLEHIIEAYQGDFDIKKYVDLRGEIISHFTQKNKGQTRLGNSH